MGILNVTPDSFSDGGRHFATDAAIAHGRALHAAGAQLVDVGGESTRPGAARVDPTEEQERVLPVIAALAADGIAISIDTMNASTAGAARVDPAEEQKRVLPVVAALAADGIAISVDTMNASTAGAAVAAGARIVNDVSGGLADPDMLATVAASGADVVLQHWRGHSTDMYARAQYDDVVREVVGELVARREAAAAAGISPDRVILDPGIGFGKRGEQNWEVLRELDRIVGIGSRVLVGTSRKRFLTETLAAADADAAAGDDGASETIDESRTDLATSVTSVLAARAGAWAVRVHDVAATRDALAVWSRWEGR